VTMAPSSGRRWLWSILQLEDGEGVKEGHTNHQGITWEGVALIKDGSGGGNSAQN
jgi:hypothetical protein